MRIHQAESRTVGRHAGLTAIQVSGLCVRASPGSPDFTVDQMKNGYCVLSPIQQVEWMQFLTAKNAKSAAKERRND